MITEKDRFWMSHKRNDPKCDGCHRPIFPYKCYNDCHGLLHSHIEDEDSDGNVWGMVYCDVCDDKWSE
jgi:hypothetical protein